MSKQSRYGIALPTTGGSLSLRRARPQDANRLREIAIASKSHWGYDAARVRAWAATAGFSPDGLRRKDIYIAEVGGRAAGWVALIPNGPVCWLDDLWVEPDWIGRGIGKRLFRHAEKRARELGATAIEWEAEPNAVGFYEAMGARYLRDSEPSEWGRVLPVMGLALREPQPT